MTAPRPATGLRAACLLALLALILAAAPAQAAPTTIAGLGSAAGRVSSPLGTAVDDLSGDLYVADNSNVRIDKFDSEGHFLLAWGFGVADGKSEALQTCGPEATPPTVRCFGPDFSTNSDAGNIRPESVAVDQASHAVYVADSQRRRVTKFGPSGELDLLFGPDVAFAGPGDTGADETQTLTVKASAGTFALSLTVPVPASVQNPPKETTAPLPYDATHEEVQEALEALAGVEPGDLTVSGGPGDATGSVPYEVHFTGGPFEGNYLAPMGSDSTKLVGSQTVTVQGASGGAFKLSFKGSETTPLPYNATHEEVQAKLEALASIGAGNVAVAGAAGGPWTVTFTGALAGSPQPPISASRKGAGYELTPSGSSVSVAPPAAAVTTTVPGGGPEVCEPSRGDLCKAAAGSGALAGELTSPSTVFVDAAGHLWVGDKERVLEFDSEGSFVAEAAVPGSGGVVRGIGFDQTSGETKSGHLYLKSGLLSGVREYEVTGAPPTLTLTQVGELDGAGSARALAVDSAGSVYVGDCAKEEHGACVAYRFLRYDNTGALKAVFGAGEVIGQPGGVFGGNPLALDEARGALYAASSDEKERSAVQRFSLPVPGPLPADVRAENLLPTTATLAATLNPEGQATEYRFEYLTRDAYEEQGDSFEGPATVKTAEVPLPGTGFEAEAVSAAIDHLIPGTEYLLRIVASNSEGEAEEQASFTTLPAIAIEAQWSSEVAARSAALQARLDPLGGEKGEWWLEYDTAPYAEGEGPHGTSAPVPHPALPESFGPLTVGAVLRGLEPATTYHYRFAAKDTRDGTQYTVHGPDRSFATAPEALGLTLPDGRAWEMVSPPDKHGGAIRLGYGEGHIQAAANGEAVAYLSAGSLEERPEGSRAPERASVLSRRSGPGLWSSADLSTPNVGVSPTPVGFGFEYKLFDPNLASALLEPRSDTPLSPSASERTPYLRQNAAPAYTPLLSGCPEPPTPCPPAIAAVADVPAGTVFGVKPLTNPSKAATSATEAEGASADLAHVALYSRVPLAEGIAGSALYLWSATEPPQERLQTVSELPAAKGGAVVPGVLGSYNGSVQNAVSAGGARVFWSAGAPSSLPSALYVRDTGRDETLRLDEVQDGFGTGASRPVFQGASADGSVAFFTDTRNLTPEANENGADLYRCLVVVEGGALKCQLSDLSAQTVDPFESAEVQGLLAGMSEDGARAYLVARGVLEGQGSAEATPGAPNLYLWEAGEGMRFIATLGEGDEHDWGGFSATLPDAAPAKAEQSAAASPSGRYLAFMSALPLTGYDNRDAKSGEAAMEVFRYDAEANGGAGQLICASCNPSGARPAAFSGGPGVGGAPFYDFQQLWSGGQALAATLPDATRISRNGPSLHRPRAVHDNGRLFFNAADGLVSADSNGNWDVYEYEPSGLGSCSASSGGAGAAHITGGCVSLISSGSGEEEAAFLDAGVGGEDAFFFTPARLSALDEDEVTDVYDARAGGVEVRRESLAECLGEACQPPAVAPPLQTPASAAFRGPGNPSAKPARKPCPKGKRKVRRGGKARCVRHERNKGKKHKHRARSNSGKAR